VDPANLLLMTIFLPLLGALWIAVIARGGQAAVRQSALVTTVLTFVLAVLLLSHLPPDGSVAAQVDVPWLEGIPGVNIGLNLALDGLSSWLFGLAALLMITSVLVSWKAIEDRPAAFYSLLLLLESGMLGVFAARDVILFYVFFEFTLIPLFFLIGIWGSEQRRYAAIKFFLYTLAGSMLTFLGLLTIVLYQYFEGRPSGGEGVLNFSIPQLTAWFAQHPMPRELQIWVFLALFAGFAVKVPLYPLHTWLPLAHVQAPTAGSVILAGVLLKIGTYGFLRFNVAMLPEATTFFVPFMLWLSVAGIIYGALVALVQTDIKRLIAYSSVSHLGFCMLGMFALTRVGVQGSVLQMVNHGLSTGGLFACVGMLYERYHTREIAKLGGLAREVPILAFFMLVFTFSSIGLPGLNGFAGEFMILLGAFQRSWDSSPAWFAQFISIAVLSVLGVVLGAWYMLYLIQRVFFGPLRVPAHDEVVSQGAHKSDAPAPAVDASHDHHGPIRDLSLREIVALVPLCVFMLWIGLQPGYFTDRLQQGVNNAMAQAARMADGEYAAETQRLAAADSRTADELATPRQIASKPDELEGERRGLD
jgi:NADH-quinone oxidoreductase subunit M